MATKKLVALWSPRILCIGAILFVSMFALDSFGPGIPFGQQLMHFFIHLIPTYVLLLLLVIAWRWQLVGGILFTTVGIVISPFVYSLNFHRTHSVWVSFIIILMITVPFIVAGILFILSHYTKKKRMVIH
jgi:hypothetical protein